MKTLFAKKRLGILLLMLIIALGVMIPLTQSNPMAVGKTIVVNPGHMDGVDSGAVNSTTGLREVDLNNALAIKVVTALRNEGYNAILSHPIPGNPGLPTLLSSLPDYSAYSTTICNTANSRGIDLLISIHHNSGGNASGYELYWSSYHPSIDNNGIYEVTGLWPGGVTADLDSTLSDTAVKSRELANSFNENFKNLGYVPCRDKVVERDDAITRKTSMPSVLIEAGFISNNEEALKLADGNNQQKMADEIAQSVSELFGGSSVTARSITSSIDSSTSDKFNIITDGIEYTNGFNGISCEVWSDNNGNDDVCWYAADKQANGSYVAYVDTAKHGYELGTYTVRVYGKDGNDSHHLLGTITVNINFVMTATSVTNSGSPTNKDSFVVTTNGLTSNRGVNGVSYAVTSESNGVTQWYGAETKDNGKTYTANILISRHNNATGKYSIVAYGKDQHNIHTIVGKTEVTVTDGMIAESITVNETPTDNDWFEISAAGISSAKGINGVSYEVWTENNGQDDVKWYAGAKQSNGSYLVKIETQNHRYETGKYIINIYGKDSNNKHYLMGTKEVNVNNTLMTATSVTNSGSPTNKDSFVVTTNGLTSNRGVNGVSYAVTSESNGVTQWYGAETKDNGKTYTANILISRHNNATGKYTVVAYGKDRNDVHNIIGKTEVTVTDGMVAESITVNETPTDNDWFEVLTAGISSAKGINGVSYEVWTENNGQDDVKWYAGAKQSNGSYLVKIETQNHRYETGKYIINIYGKDSNNKHYLMGTKEVNVNNTLMTATSVTNSGSPTNKDSFVVITNGLTSNRGVNGVSYAVTSESNGITQWYGAETQDNGKTYTANILISRHNNATGKYTVVAYGKDRNDVHNIVGKTEVTVTAGMVAESITVNETPTDNDWFEVLTAGISSAKGINGVSYEVWTENNGQDDVKWYAGTKQSNGSYLVKIETQNHRYETGKYIINIYGKDSNNKHYLMGTKEVNVNNTLMTATSVTNSGSPTNKDSFVVITNGLTSNRGVNGVSYAVTSESNGITQWYGAETQDNGASYTAKISTGRHDYASGKYSVVAYGKDRDDRHIVVGNTEVIVTMQGTPIMGESKVTVEQLVDFYNKNGRAFPNFYVQRNVDLEKFAQMYIEECGYEGVRAEVAFTQAMLETGFLKFGGDVKIEQFNFAGLGASGGGVPGNSFSKYGDNETGIRMGIRAQVQHLKGYASLQPLNLTKVDERFFDSIRGKAPYVEWLGIPDNPFGAGWAAAANYGSRIIGMMNEL